MYCYGYFSLIKKLKVLEGAVYILYHHDHKTITEEKKKENEARYLTRCKRFGVEGKLVNSVLLTVAMMTQGPMLADTGYSF